MNTHRYAAEVEAVSRAIRDARRCPAYDDPEYPCDSLEGCESCLEAAAKAALRAVEERT